jgi:para-nitrobenzyl esterase
MIVHPATWRRAWLAAASCAAPANLAATGTPLRRPCPGAFSGADRTAMLSLVPPQPQVETDFAARHHCSLWAGG